MSNFDALRRKDDSQAILDANSMTLAEIEARNAESARRSAKRAALKESRAHPVEVKPSTPQPPLDALQVREPGSSRIIDLPGPQIADIHLVITRTLEDGGFSPRAAEVKAMREALEEDSKLCAEIEAHGEDRLRKQRKEELPHATAPLKHIDLIVHEARQYVRTLKQRRAALRKRVGPVVTGMLERAVLSADVVVEILTENETGRAEDFGVAYEPSNTLKAITVARRMLAEASRVSARSPDLVDLMQVCKLLGIQAEQPKHGGKLLGFIEA